MGEYVTEGNQTVYRQSDGEITAWLIGFEEKMELRHEGSPLYRRILQIFVATGAIYLAVVLGGV